MRGGRGAITLINMANYNSAESEQGGFLRGAHLYLLPVD